MSDAAAVPRMGECRFCGCTDAEPCKLSDGEACGWVNALRTVCSNWSCLARWAAEKKRARGSRRRELREFREGVWRNERERRLREARERRERAARRKKSKGRAA